MHDLAIAYELLLNQKKHKQQIADVFAAQQAAIRSPPSSSPSIDMAGLMGTSPLSPPRMPFVPSNSSSSDSGSGGGSSGRDRGPAMHVDAATSRRRRWYLGIQSKKDPANVMTEVYKAMLSLGCRWSAMNNYRVVCMYNDRQQLCDKDGQRRNTVTPGMSPPSSGLRAGAGINSGVGVTGMPHSMEQEPVTATGHLDAPRAALCGETVVVPGQVTLNLDTAEVTETETGTGVAMELESPVPPPSAASDYGHSRTKVALSLYKVQQSIYLLDFQRVEGEPFSFMRLCALIVAELKNLSAASRAQKTRDQSQKQQQQQEQQQQRLQGTLGGASAEGHVFGSTHIAPDPTALHPAFAHAQSSAAAGGRRASQ
jgi:5'-AMP-activated protein kinase catalytic alpha subunit